MTDKLKPGLLPELLLETFINTTFKVTICYGYTIMPEKEERKNIVKSLQDSLVGGHRGVISTISKNKGAILLARDAERNSEFHT